MADKKISELTVLAGSALAVGDEFVIVDISDTTMASSGTDKSITAIGSHGFILQSPAYVASFTPDPTLGDFIKVGTLTGNITINLPATAYPGQQFVLELVQDAVGGRTITFNAGYVAAPNGSTVALKKSFWVFLYDGAFWYEMSSTIGF